MTPLAEEAQQGDAQADQRGDGHQARPRRRFHAQFSRNPWLGRLSYKVSGVCT